MSLTARERHELDRIEDEIAGSDPGLARMLSTFTSLAEGEDMPARESTWRCDREKGRDSSGPVVQRTWRSSRGWRLLLPVLWLLLAIAVVMAAMTISRLGSPAHAVHSAASQVQQPPGHGPS